jgi:symplekin
VDDDDDDYEPDFSIAEDTEQILNKLDTASIEFVEPPLTEVAIGPFTMPPPPPLTVEEVSEIGKNTLSRVFGTMQALDESVSKKAKSGFNRLAASSNDKEAWVTVITRLATRSIAGLDSTNSEIKVENGVTRHHGSLNRSIRDALYLYVVEDFRKRIDIAVAWLCEEWYNDKMQIKTNSRSPSHYETWVLKVLDGIMPYLDARDKFLTRFLSEIPGLNQEMLERVKGLCRDPAMVNLALTSLLYLVMMRPPARELALDAVEDVWMTCM